MKRAIALLDHPLPCGNLRGKIDGPKACAVGLLVLPSSLLHERSKSHQTDFVTFPFRCSTPPARYLHQVPRNHTPSHKVLRILVYGTPYITCEIAANSGNGPQQQPTNPSILCLLAWDECTGGSFSLALFPMTITDDVRAMASSPSAEASLLRRTATSLMALASDSALALPFGGHESGGGIEGRWFGARCLK